MQPPFGFKKFELMLKYNTYKIMINIIEKIKDIEYQNELVGIFMKIV